MICTECGEPVNDTYRRERGALKVSRCVGVSSLHSVINAITTITKETAHPEG